MYDSLTLAIVGHLVGDYLLQTDWMALNKKQRFLPCAVHCTLWSLSVAAFTGWWSPAVLLTLFVTHFLQDRTGVIKWWMTLPWKDQSKFLATDTLETPQRGEVITENSWRLVVGLGPWSAIVVDNVWHIVDLWAIWRFLVPVC